MNRLHIIVPIALGISVSACERPADEFRAALPTQDTVQVSVPQDASASQGQGLASSKRGVVGERSDFYDQTHKTAREINAFGTLVVDLVQTISDYPPTTIDLNRAVWGPFSEEADPNEFRLVSIKRSNPQLHYLWKIEARVKGDGDDSWLIITGGAFEPTTGDDGRGWFGFDFDVLTKFDPQESGNGRIAYAFEKDSASGVAVALLFDGIDENGSPAQGAYAFGEDIKGRGYMGFASKFNINDVEDNLPEQENVVIFAHWGATGAGRVDIIANGGDLEVDRVRGAQCWDSDFVSTFELFTAVGDEGRILATAGERSSCTLEEVEVPELPTGNELSNPYAGEMGELD